MTPMIYETLFKLMRKHLYFVFHEKYRNELGSNLIDRFVAKHPFLRPELIVVNDQPHGFKRLSEDVASLEKFPIYLEVEYAETEGDKFIENVDLYSEARIKCKDRLSDVIYLSNVYAKTVYVERIKRVTDPSFESLVVYSRINELFTEEYLEQDLEEGLVTEQEVELMFDVHLSSFVNFVKVLDDVLVKGKKLSHIDQIFNPPPA